jgi:hypothetical protein
MDQWWSSWKRKEQVDRLLSEGVVHMPGGEIAFPWLFETKMMPTRCFRCHEYGHTQLRCLNTPDSYTSLVSKCAACRGPHQARCATFRKGRRRLQILI